ncbi:MAG: GMC oxidoreductase [Myxococcota bacterium]
MNGADERLLLLAQRPDDTPFDYVIVGSGAGGGPLAARLALNGRRVLLIDAGSDPAAAGETFECPAYHGAATEDKSLSWQFSVRHYTDTARQGQDSKYDQAYPPDARFLDPASRGGTGRGGIFYPRAAALGGCTAHHAMIVVAPNDIDWDHIANLTGDESWRPSQMRGYFARLEKCLYIASYQRWFQRLLGPLYKLWQWVVLLFSPRSVLDEGGHGSRGWQPTNFIDPNLIQGLAARDRNLVSVLMSSALAVLHGNSRLIGLLKRSLLLLRVVQHIDPNDQNTRKTSPEGVFLIPTGISAEGKRTGVREFLQSTQKEYPDRLVIQTQTHVTRVLFAPPVDGEPPRAIGVEAALGAHLYEASPLRLSEARQRVRLFAKREVILCGGAFNTPQLLLLSGIGDPGELGNKPSCVLHGADGAPLSPERPRRIDLPGVGKNLQDRYEVSVISELDEELESLAGATFRPGDAADPLRRDWRRDGTGLYATNGGTLAVLARSKALQADQPEPDLFAFGVPAAFRGYYFGWSRELLRRTLRADTDQRNLWSWVVLKAYTHNDAGSVTLRSENPFEQPEICFDSFNEAAERRGQELAAERERHAAAGLPAPAKLVEDIAANDAILENSRRDLAALADAVALMRRVNARNPHRFVREVQPGPARADGSKALEQWIRDEAWGHHASCTCRIGSDPWRGNTAELRDRDAVLDSRFRVHGVKGLRVVDASVFPRIPGYFIVAPVMMVSEKAADVLLAEPGDEVYAPAFRAHEAAALRKRRFAAGRATPVLPGEDETRLPRRTVGLALSGGGIRSATFALGVLQALSARDRLRDVDFLSTVSGGGFTGSFLGRLFTRPLVTASNDPVGRVQDTLLDNRSGPMWWLRTQANYLFASGGADLRQNLAIFLRSFSSVHAVVGALIFAAFGALVWLAQSPPPVPVVRGVELSPWWKLPLYALALGVLPAAIAFWLSQRLASYRPYPYLALGAWLVLVAGALCLWQPPAPLPYAGWTIAILAQAWLWQDVARWGADSAGAAFGVGQTGTIVRNRLTRALGEMLAIFAALTLFVVLDTFAALVAKSDPGMAWAVLAVALAPALPLLRWIALGALRQVSAGGVKGISLVRLARMFGVPLAVCLLFALDLLAHRLFRAHPDEALRLLSVVVAFSLVIGRAFSFLNLSSLRAVYTARLSRTFLGASNPARVYGAPNEENRDVQSAHPDDDMPYERYHPEANGGPLHLINVCINETLDFASEREVRERKGVAMCVTPHGVVVGRRYFSNWAPPAPPTGWQRRRRWRSGLGAESPALRPLPTESDPNAFHVLKSRKAESAQVEGLTLSGWTAISGAAFSTGTGRSTTLPLALFMGLLNVRLGYWWDSGIRASERPGRYPPALWRMLKRLPASLFTVQGMLLAEWRARFRGPSQWFWYLSDGGHFEVTGLYELLRRRVELMIVTDAGEDPRYQFGDLAQLAQQARMDLGADLDWLAAPPPGLPAWIQGWFDANAVGRIGEIHRSAAHSAAFARVTYRGDTRESWLLLLKPNLTRATAQDVRTYAAGNPAFPQDSTFDQVFDDTQWESYRALGQQIGLLVLR